MSCTTLEPDILSGFLLDHHAWSQSLTSCLISLRIEPRFHHRVVPYFLRKMWCWQIEFVFGMKLPFRAFTSFFISPVYVSVNVSNVSWTSSPVDGRGKALLRTLLSSLHSTIIRPLLSAYKEELFIYCYHCLLMFKDSPWRLIGSLTAVDRSST